MKKFLILTIAIIALFCSNIVCAGVIPTEVLLNQNLKITYNEEIQRFKNVNGDVVYPISYEGTTYLPIRSISSLFETEIEWDGNTNSIYLGKGTLDTVSAETMPEFVKGIDKKITVDLNQDIKIYHNGEVQTFKDVNGKVVYPLSYQGTTYLPVRAISNLYNANIDWNGETKTVSITKNKEEQDEFKTDIFKISGYSYGGGVADLIVDLEETEDYIYINNSIFNFHSSLCNYTEDIRLQITYSTKDYKVKSCKFLNALTGAEITDLSEENIKKLFDVEYGKTIIEKEWSEEIKLSELLPNTIYKYTASKTCQHPEIINDIQRDCIIYTKSSNDFFDENYEREINLCNNIDGHIVSFSFDEFENGESFNVMYKTVTTNELLKLIDEEDILKLKGYKTGDELTYSFVEYMYNDTNSDITLIVENNVFDIDYTDIITIEAGKIYGFSWMIDSVKIK